MKKILFPVLAVLLAAATVLTVNSCKKDEDSNDIQNTAPKASFTVTPSSGTIETQFEFDASACSDEEEETSTLEVRWDWESDGSWDTDWSSNKIINHKFNTEGAYTVALEVKDSKGLKDLETHDVSVHGGGGGSGCDGQTSLIYDGQTYDIVEIGNQCWMAENLNYQTGDSWCYENNSSNCDTYGRLYDWSTALGVCPSGWHLPSDDEWKILEGNADTQYGVGDPKWDDTGYRGYDAGKRLKSTTGWYQNTGTDAFGITALPGGYRYGSGSFLDLGINGLWWSATENGSTDAWHRTMGYFTDNVYRFSSSKGHGFSVRCLKDD